MKTIELTLEDRIGLVKKWLLDSGIQSEKGGFYAWQDMEDESHSYLYSEITGYGITTLCFLYKITKEDIFLKKARSAARWILRFAFDNTGAVLTRDYIKETVEHYSFERGNIYSFDCAMVAFGMIRLYEITYEDEYIDCAEKIIKFLNSRMSGPDGLYYPVFDTKKNAAYEDPGKWSTQSGSFHCKLALCLCAFARIKKDERFIENAGRLIGSSLGNFYREGRFITSVADNSSHLHPYSYALEGMLYYACKSGRDDYLDTVKEAFDWIAGYQQDKGGFPTIVLADGKIKVSYQRCDIQAQILRLSYFIKSGIDRERLIESFLEQQNITRGYKGAFLFGADMDGTVKYHSNAWCSMFALQALYLVSGRVDKDIVLDYLV